MSNNGKIILKVDLPPVDSSAIKAAAKALGQFTTALTPSLVAIAGFNAVVSDAHDVFLRWQEGECQRLGLSREQHDRLLKVVTDTGGRYDELIAALARFETTPLPLQRIKPQRKLTKKQRRRHGW